MRLALLDLEQRAGDRVGDGAAELGAGGGVEAAGEHQRRRGDRRRAASVVPPWAMKASRVRWVSSGDCLYGNAITSSMIAATVPSLCARGGVDEEEEGLEEVPLARGGAGQPVDEASPTCAAATSIARPRALQDEAADQLRMPQRQLLADDAAAGEAGHVGGRDAQTRRRTAAASSAIASTVDGPSGIAVRPAPRLSKAVIR